MAELATFTIKISQIMYKEVFSEAEIAEATPLSDYEIERNKPMPSLNHGLVQANLIAILWSLYRTQFSVISELSLTLSGWKSVPDVCLFPKKSFNPKKDRITVEEPPICAIEIISPSQSSDLLSEKADEYFAHGVQSCWLVFPRFEYIQVYSSPDSFEIYRKNEVLKDEVLGISIPIAEVFQ